MIKILILGSGNINPINVVTKNLKQFGSQEYQIDGLNLYKNKNGRYEYLDNQFEIYPEKSLSALPKKFKSEFICDFLFSKQIIRNLIIFKLNIKKISLNIKNQIIQLFYKNQIINKISEYDIVNVHFLHYWQCEIIPQIPQQVGVVISFWGSDLMATSGVNIYKMQFNAIQRANKITVVSEEMKEIFLSKFGRNLKSKVQLALFGMDQEQVDFMILEKTRLRKIGFQLIKEAGFDPSNYKYIIKIGYNAFESQNHITILHEMAHLETDIRESTLFVVPMTYGLCRNGYKEDVETTIKELNLNGIVLKEYLTDEVAKSISCVCNIMFNLRDNDALNNSLLESLISGAIVFNGSWLPYKLLKKKGLHYIEVHDLAEISTDLESVISEFDSQIEKCNKNAEKLNGFISGKENTVKWENALVK